jgi:hypothetical protein
VKNSVLAGAAITHALLSIRARKKRLAPKVAYAAQGAIAVFCAAGAIEALSAKKALKAAAIAALGGAAIAALNKLEDIYGE